jgi:hypothetical protein
VNAVEHAAAPPPVHDAFEPPGARVAEPISIPYSGLGLASLLLAVAAGIGIFTSIGYIAYYQLTTGLDATAQRSLMVVIGLVIFACALLAVVGTVLGLVGLFQSDRRKLLAVLGTCFNLLVMLIFVVLYAIGLSAA